MTLTFVMWFLLEIVDFKDCLRIGKIVLLQVGVYSGVRRPEVRDSTGSAEPSSGHYHNTLSLVNNLNWIDKGERTICY